MVRVGALYFPFLVTKKLIKAVLVLVHLCGLNERRVSQTRMSECSICYEPVTDHPAPDATGSLRTSCGHLFHPKCLWKWYSGQERGSCPLCRGAATELGDIEREEPERREPIDIVRIPHLELEGILREMGGTGVTGDVLISVTGLANDGVGYLARQTLEDILAEQNAGRISDERWASILATYSTRLPREYDNDEDGYRWDLPVTVVGHNDWAAREWLETAEDEWAPPPVDDYDTETGTDIVVPGPGEEIWHHSWIRINCEDFNALLVSQGGRRRRWLDEMLGFTRHPCLTDISRRSFDNFLTQQGGRPFLDGRWEEIRTLHPCPWARWGDPTPHGPIELFGQEAEFEDETPRYGYSYRYNYYRVDDTAIIYMLSEPRP